MKNDRKGARGEGLGSITIGPTVSFYLDSLWLEMVLRIGREGGPS